MIKSMTNDAVGVYRIVLIKSYARKEKFWIKRKKIVVLVLFANGLHDDCSLSRVDVCFYKD